jgi:hypothetical protein
MAYINQPPDLRAIQEDIDNRLSKLELAQRFTAPAVTSNPTNPRTGDIWYNTTDVKLRALLTAVVDLVTTGVANTFTALQTFSQGISVANGATITSGTLTATAVTSNLGVTNTGNLLVNGAITGQVSGVTVIAMSNDGNGSIEIGRVDGTGTTPFIDFHAGATATDFDVRMIASGGTGVAGAGTLQIQGGRFNLSTANVNLASISTATTIGAAGGASALPATPLGYIIIEIGGTQRKIPYYNV